MEVTIVAASDEWYIMFFIIMVTSVLTHSQKEDHYSFKLLTDGLSRESQQKIEQLKEKYSCSIDLLIVDTKKLKKIPTMPHLSCLTNARLQIPSLLPELKKIIYLDCDMIACGDLAQLWGTDLSGYPVAACVDYGDMAMEINIPPEEYFNAGMLVLDLEKLRKSDFETGSMELINKEAALTNDQHILNRYFHRNWLKISCRWNMQAEINGKRIKNFSIQAKEDFRNSKNHPAIIHYSGGKPTSMLYRGAYQKEFWQYLKMTSYSGYKKNDCNLKNFLIHYAPDWALEFYEWYRRYDEKHNSIY